MTESVPFILSSIHPHPLLIHICPSLNLLLFPCYCVANTFGVQWKGTICTSYVASMFAIILPCRCFALSNQDQNLPSLQIVQWPLRSSFSLPSISLHRMHVHSPKHVWRGQDANPTTLTGVGGSYSQARFFVKILFPWCSPHSTQPIDPLTRTTFQPYLRAMFWRPLF